MCPEYLAGSSCSGFRLSHNTMCVHENGKKCDGVEDVQQMIRPEKEFSIFFLPLIILRPLYASSPNSSSFICMFIFVKVYNRALKSFCVFCGLSRWEKVLVSYFPHGNKIFRSTYFQAHQGEEAARKILRQGSCAVVEN